MILNREVSAQLLAIVKTALYDLYKTDAEHTTPPDIDIDYQGAFVTLHIDDELRGCIGYLDKIKPLGKAIYELAQKSATTDMRFEPVREDELERVSTEITLLGPMEHIESANEIEIGTHGVYIERGLKRGILLPQVASERGWTPERFIEAVCEKAHLPLDALKSPDAELKRFTAVILPQVPHNKGT